MARMTIDETLRLALSHHNAGRLTDAERLYRQVLASHPSHSDALHLLGVLAFQGKQMDIARDLIERAITIFPAAANYHFNLGHVLLSTGRRHDAIASYRRAIALRPNYADAYNSLGVALADEGQWQAAIEAYRRALDSVPASADYLSNLSNALREDGQLEAALAAAHRACELQPGLAAGHNNLGAALLQQGRFEEAISSYRRAIELEPDYGTAHYNLATALLMVGRMEEGWRHAEWRWKAKDLNLVRPDFSQPCWDGSPLGGKRIFLHTEQGFGDVIQFVRYVPQVVALGGTVILGLRKELGRLMKCIPGVDAIVTDGDALPAFDVQCPMLTLPLAMKTTLATIPGPTSYLRADPEMIARWRQRIAVPGDTRLKVGLVWAGRPDHKNDRNRSITLQMLAPLGEIAGVRFFSLQKGEAARQIQSAPPGMNPVDLGGEMEDFADCAGVLENLDLLISVDTAAAHLAGALGKPVWTLLPFVPDWRWMLDRGDSPWYPTMRLFRQPAIGVWRQPIDRLARELAGLNL